MEKPEPGKHTTILVGALMGSVLVWIAFMVAGWKVGLALSIILAYEGWTLVNSHPEDTISESIWRLAKRPMVPFLFGLGLGYLLALGVFGPVGPAVLGGTAFFLAGHFFFQKQEMEPRRRTKTGLEYYRDQAIKRRHGMPFDKDAADVWDALVDTLRPKL